MVSRKEKVFFKPITLPRAGRVVRPPYRGHGIAERTIFVREGKISLQRPESPILQG
jgi:hypothetical protein